MKKNQAYTAEASSEGQPDKVCDLISDSVVDLCLAADSNARVAVEVSATTNHVLLTGEIRVPAAITEKAVVETVRKAVKKIGFEQQGFHWKHISVDFRLHHQLSDVLDNVDDVRTFNRDEASGDAGSVIGYACNETVELMPAPISFAHKILRSLTEARHSGSAPFLGPDAKCQVSIAYIDGKPTKANSIVVSTQHSESIDVATLREHVRPHVLRVIPSGWMCDEDKFYVNPTGRFVIGGPDGDAGLTGRKIIEDTYGGTVPHGGGAFSGKDPSKIDRAGSYAARYLAKNVVAAGLAERCTVRLSYAIGLARPISVDVDTDGTGLVEEELLSEALQSAMDLSPRGIRTHLNLNKPIYARTATHGHFGRNPDADGGFSWERLDLAEDLRNRFPHDLQKAKDVAASSKPAAISSIDRLTFIVPCDSVTVEVAKSVLQIISTLLRRQIPEGKIEATLHEDSSRVLTLTIGMEYKFLPAVRHFLSDYMDVVSGKVEPEELFTDPILAAEMRIQRRQAFLVLQNRLDVLNAEKTALTRTIADFRERLTDMKASQSIERADYRRRVKFLEERLKQFQKDYDKYVGTGPEIVKAALKLAGKSAPRHTDLAQILRTIEEIRSIRSDDINPNLLELKAILIEMEETRSDDKADLQRIVGKIQSEKPKIIQKIYQDLSLGSISGIAGNALWEVIKGLIS